MCREHGVLTQLRPNRGWRHPDDCSRPQVFIEVHFVPVPRLGFSGVPVTYNEKTGKPGCFIEMALPKPHWRLTQLSPIKLGRKRSSAELGKDVQQPKKTKTNQLVAKVLKHGISFPAFHDGLLSDV